MTPATFREAHFVVMAADVRLAQIADQESRVKTGVVHQFVPVAASARRGEAALSCRCQELANRGSNPGFALC